MTFPIPATQGSASNRMTWTTVTDGKAVVRAGTFQLEKSSNLFHPSTTTWCVRIRDLSPDYSSDAVVHLVHVRVDQDCRFPAGEVVRTFRDVFRAEYLFRMARGFARPGIEADVP